MRRRQDEDPVVAPTGQQAVAATGDRSAVDVTGVGRQQRHGHPGRRVGRLGGGDETGHLGGQFAGVAGINLLPIAEAIVRKK